MAKLSIDLPLRQNNRSLSIFLFMLVGLLFSVAEIKAQGNDFSPGGFVPNVPPLGQPGYPGGFVFPQGGGYTNGSTAWVQVPARRGDTITFDMVMDGWNLSYPLLLIPVMDNAQSIDFVGGHYGQGIFGRWC